MKTENEEITCSKCKETKPLDCFQFRTDSGIYRKQCKLCRQSQNTKDKRRRYREDPDHFKDVRRTYWRGNKKMLAWNRKYQKQYRENNLERARKNARERKAERYGKDIQFTLCHKLRARFKQAVRSKYKTGSAVRDLGCSVEELVIYLESLFQDGMSWDNYGEWHIDHIRPLASFDLTDREQVKQACHYTNLQPLWAKENLSKGAKYND